MTSVNCYFAYDSKNKGWVSKVRLREMCEEWCCEHGGWYSPCHSFFFDWTGHNFKWSMTCVCSFCVIVASFTCLSRNLILWDITFWPLEFPRDLMLPPLPPELERPVNGQCLVKSRHCLIKSLEDWTLVFNLTVIYTSNNGKFNSIEIWYIIMFFSAKNVRATHHKLFQAIPLISAGL